MICWRSFTTVVANVQSSSSSSMSMTQNSAYSYLYHRGRESSDDQQERLSMTQEQQESDVKQKQKQKQNDPLHNGGGSNGIRGVQVPRQQYIPVPKSDLLNAIVSTMFDSEEEEEIDQFIRFSSCLDSIIHAEHKSILEQMRLDFDQLHSTTTTTHSAMDSDSAAAAVADHSYIRIQPTTGPLPSNSSTNFTTHSLHTSRVAVATRFQHAFMQLLDNAQFEELSARDLLLTSALNNDYLLTLPIYVDWKKASESNAIIFRRGYTTERQKGLLIVEKLDYLQSKLLQGVFSIIARPLGMIGNWIAEAFESASQGQDAQVWTKRIKVWLEEQPLFQQPYNYSEQTSSDNLLGVDQPSDSDLPIWIAAQRAVTRYKGILSPFGPRGQLLRKLLMWTGLIPSTPNLPFQLNSDLTTSESYLRPVYLPRISLSDIWEPATRRSCGNDLWKMLKASISVLLSQSTLQEPAFQDIILLYTEESGGRDQTEDKVDFPSLKLKIYERVSVPDLPVVFPHKKLSFRILDTVRLDVATILGLLAYFINYKFEDILSSPSAIFLDVISTTALIVYVIRVALGYKQTRDRYQLLVNRTLYEKTLASGFGSVQFLLDASEQQQYKEAILAYGILLKAENGQCSSLEELRDRCERFIYNSFKDKVKIPVDKAINTLVRLGLVTEETTCLDGKIGLQALPCLEAHQVLKQRWNSLLD